MIHAKDAPEFSVAVPTLLRDTFYRFLALVDGCLQFLRDKQSEVLLRRLWFRCLLCELFCRFRLLRVAVFGGFDLLRFGFGLGNVFLLRHDERKWGKWLSPDRLDFISQGDVGRSALIRPF